MGGGGSSYTASAPSMQENPYTKQLADMASQLWGQTQPIRTAFTDKYFMPFLEGNYKPETMPGFAPGYSLLRSNYEGQYNTAKNNILANTPRGGALTNALSNLEYNRAKGIGDATSSLSNNLIGDLWNKAYNTAWVTSPSQSFSGMGTASQTEQSALNSYLAAEMQAQQINAAQQLASNQAKSSGLGLLGTGIGSLVGLLNPLSVLSGKTSSSGSDASGLSGLFGSGIGGLTSGLTSELGGGLGGLGALVGLAAL